MQTASAVMSRASEQLINNIFQLDKVSSEESYAIQSEHYSLKGDFTMELIENPWINITTSNKKRLKNELGHVLMGAFEKKEEDAQQFLSGSKLEKVAVLVDWLIVVRDKGFPVAFGSGSFISPSVFYLNGAMVLPQYQSTGVGLLSNALMWKRAVEERQKQGDGIPYFICRTHNKNVASVLTGFLDESTISTEEGINPKVQMICKKTADFLACHYDETTGVCNNVYPSELPKGSKKNNSRIEKAFHSVGTLDACFIVGKLNLNLTQRLIDRMKITRLDKENDRESIFNIEAA